MTTNNRANNEGVQYHAGPIDYRVGTASGLNITFHKSLPLVILIGLIGNSFALGWAASDLYARVDRATQISLEAREQAAEVRTRVENTHEVLIRQEAILDRLERAIKRVEGNG